MKAKSLIEKLNKAFPGCNAVSTEEWDGRKGGIWFRGTEFCSIDELPLYSEYVHQDTMGVHPRLDELLAASGWFAEPYDAGTLMAYPA